ncbi:hypothetical protein HY030_01705 [Candidatus Gottesmanbacteria bacterium]|nr:hypothetical protein [Candidatus Gottesmanbacteria bacterium]
MSEETKEDTTVLENDLFRTEIREGTDGAEVVAIEKRSGRKIKWKVPNEGKPVEEKTIPTD